MGFEFFLFLTFLIALVTLGGIIIAYRRSHDSFHPLIYLGLMFFALYCYIPLDLLYSDLEGLRSFLSIDQLEYVQALNLLGILSLYAGVLCGDGRINRLDYSGQLWSLPPVVCKRIDRAAIILGVIGVVCYLYGIVSVGGITAAYGRSYGGGWSTSGYAREAILLTLPALLWIMTTHVQRRMSKLDWGWITLFTLPLLIQGLLGARRGPTAMILAAVFIGWHLVRLRRPSLSKLIAGSIALGMLMLFLVTNRSQIYIGSDFNFERGLSDSSITKAHSGNEFIYGGGVILDADIRNRYFWGGRYITVFFIRPIPRQLWPSKYQDAADFFGIPNLETSNAGTGGTALADTVGWAGSVGAAPGIVADMWIEFWWYFVIALYAIGWVYGMSWRKVIISGGLWIPTYTILTALSVYLIMQTLEAMAFRFLFTSAANWLIMYYGTRNFSTRKTLNRGNFLP
ncbi:hypothetical protein JJD41_02230 [Oxynema sp. CENA135]|uniref:hypothetical protein n=1 Tax=Oxynema sp. CENA135 TaxID=984206 RepID=UPI00190BDF72|nr:hypothetical protein [Oxynema sp. CENA135]MBK4728708.1 hypothetical protein [Oxynema sp. CENA135]